MIAVEFVIEMNKKCFDCKIIKRFRDFNADSSKKDGKYSYCRDCHRVRVRRYNHTKRGRGLHRKSGGRWEKKNRLKKKAHSAIQRAIKKGVLKKMPCSVCGDIRSVAHHPNYNEKLRIVWLCINHHADVHAKRIKL